MKLTIYNLRLIFICLLFSFFSCSTRRTEITIVGYNKKYVEIYNGNKLIFVDTINSDIRTGVGRIFNCKVNFSDSINVITRFSDGDSLSSRVKLRKCPFVIIEHSSLDFKIYGSHKKRKFL